jgi:hypothetical protein
MVGFSLIKVGELHVNITVYEQFFAESQGVMRFMLRDRFNLRILVFDDVRSISC